MYKYISICVCVGGEDGLGVEGLGGAYVCVVELFIVVLCISEYVFP